MMTTTIDAKGSNYKELNEEIRRLVESGERHITVKNVRGQRYIGTGLTADDLLLEVEGVPGEDLAFCMGGPTLVVHGHGQNAIANTMNAGTVIVHGIAGDALAYGMRGGKLFVRDSVGYRVGIHMKEYQDLRPVVVIGGTTGDFLGEYMAGGTLIVLNRNNEAESVVGQADRTLATGIHGGEIYICNYEVPAYLPGIGSTLQDPPKADRERIKRFIFEYCEHFGVDSKPLLERDMVRIVPAGSRPYSKFYYPTYPINTGQKPIQAEKSSPCEGNCPVGIPTGRFLKHMRLGQIKEALELMDEYTPFRYSNCGYICPHLCMEKCSRGKVDFPIRTAQLAREYSNDPQISKKPANGKNVAVIGAGPSGLSAAYFLAREGYDVDVFEADTHAGGKMYQVVSRTRLPLGDLQQDLQRIASLGIHFHLGQPVDAAKFAQIYAEADHVIAATGAHRPLIPQVPGKEHIIGGLDFLKAYSRGAAMPIVAPVLVIGGGAVAMDGLEVLEEMGIAPDQITVIDVRTPAADPKEIQKWTKAGVTFRYPAFLQEVTTDGAVIKNAGGKNIFLPGKPIAFINEQPVLEYLPQSVQEQLNNRGFFSGENGLFQTADPKISIIGDASGIGLVANSIGKARDCVMQVNALLTGKPYERVIKDIINPQELHLEWNVQVAPEDVALCEEYKRCLHCGVCVECDDCVEACPRDARKRVGSEFEVDMSLCGGCGSCAAACRGGVIRMVAR